ncbi:MAG: tRNA pseudouridine(55) synthase TruB [Cyclobacteriaceae bacterium]|nr:tRNA pseudouridine(55) synthase TruB [Cyclobacteriaceae bacterium]
MAEPKTSDHVLLVDKPYRWTSFDVVNKLRHVFKIKKIGHAGTLDPLATGLLIICTGKNTKRIEEFMGLEKEYTGTLVLGHETASHDLETEPYFTADVTALSESEIREAAAKFCGVVNQTPPSHSAIRIGGKRAYEFARKGKEAPVQPREVTVHAFEITAYQPPEATFRVVCSKGTYVRSLVRDLGKELGVGAYMSSLRRTRIGPHRIEDAQTIDQIMAANQAPDTTTP